MFSRVALKPLVRKFPTAFVLPDAGHAECKPDAQDIRSIAEQKMVDLNANDVEGAMKIIAGTARSMGISVEA